MAVQQWAAIRWFRAWLQPRSTGPVERFWETIARVVIPTVLVVMIIDLPLNRIAFSQSEGDQTPYWYWEAMVAVCIGIVMAAAVLLNKGRLKLATQILSMFFFAAGLGVVWLKGPQAQITLPVLMVAILMSAMIAPARRMFVYNTLALSILVAILVAIQMEQARASGQPVQDSYVGVMFSILICFLIEFLILYLFHWQFEQHIIAAVEARKVAEEKAAEAQNAKKAAEAAAADAEKANRLKSEFLANMSHELRTPLNPIMGFATMACMSGIQEEQRKTFLEKISSNAQRLLGLVNDILDTSKIEAGRLEIASAPFQPGILVKEVTGQNEILFTQKGLKLSVNVDPQLPTTLIGDKARVAQIITNLLSNAAKFTEQGEVVVTTGRTGDGQHWHISVRDTGIGIPPHARDLIFEHFRQVDGSGTRKYGGAGLGLSICQNLARLMGGTITVQSEVEPDHHGSTFVVTLPIVQPQPVAQAA